MNDVTGPVVEFVQKRDGKRKPVRVSSNITMFREHAGKHLASLPKEISPEQSHNFTPENFSLLC